MLRGEMAGTSPARLQLYRPKSDFLSGRFQIEKHGHMASFAVQGSSEGDKSVKWDYRLGPEHVFKSLASCCEDD